MKRKQRSPSQDRQDGAQLIEQVKLDDIDVGRLDYDPVEMGKMSLSIEAVGQVINPVILRPRFGGSSGGPRYSLVSGHTRFLARQDAGAETIPARIVDLDDDQAALWRLDENLIRRSYSALRWSEMIAERVALLEVSGKAKKRTRSEIGKAARRGEQISQREPSATRLTAQLTKRTERSIQIALQIVRHIDAGLRRRLYGTWLEHDMHQLLALAQIQAEKQAEVVDLITGGDRRTVDEIVGTELKATARRRQSAASARKSREAGAAHQFKVGDRVSFKLNRREFAGGVAEVARGKVAIRRDSDEKVVRLPPRRVTKLAEPAESQPAAPAGVGGVAAPEGQRVTEEVAGSRESGATPARPEGRPQDRERVMIVRVGTTTAEAVDARAAQDAALFVVAQGQELMDAVRLVEDASFDVRDCAVQLGQVDGAGPFLRSEHLLVVVGTRGHVPAPERPTSSVIPPGESVGDFCRRVLAAPSEEQHPALH